MSEQWFEADPLWFKRAVFYEVYVRGFHDGNGDGAGDFRGLTEKLDFLQCLGADCVWLLPMYASPLRDGGYDIADFFTVHLEYGTVDDFARFVEEAHQRGIRVIADLVMNHTSSDHPWFQEARSSPDSPGLGTYEVVPSSNATVYAHVRRHHEDVVLCAHNFARPAQAAALDLSSISGMTPIEMFGRAAFPRIDDEPYHLTFGPRGLYWFQVEGAETGS